jgi:cell division protein FtsN
MKSKTILIVIVVILIAGCKRKPSDSYEFYQPYQKDSSEIAMTTPADDQAVVSQEAQTKEIKGVNPDERFFIVVASYTVEEFAKAQLRELERQGFRPGIIMTNQDGWFKLAIESHNTISDAREALTRLKRNEGIFTQAVIVQKK